jgi:hypothetical protein
MSTYTRPIFIGYHLSGLAAALGIQAFDVDGVALAARQTGVATEDGASALYTVRPTLDTGWPTTFVLAVDEGSGHVIHRETVDVLSTPVISDADKADIAARTATLLAGRKLSIGSIVQTDGSLQLYAGAAYTTASEGWPTLAGYAGPSLNGAPIELRIIPEPQFRQSGSNATAVLRKTGMAMQTGTSVLLAFALSELETGAIASVFPVNTAPTHRAQIWLTSAKMVLVDVPLTVKRGIA